MADEATSPLVGFNAPFDAPSSPESPNTGVYSSGQSDSNTAGGGSNEGSGIHWPAATDSFWKWPQELQIEWVLDREAEQRFDGAVDAYLQETGLSGFPESVKTAVNGLAWQMLLTNPEAHQSLRNGNVEVLKQYLEKARAYIHSVATEYGDFESRGPLDSLIRSFGPKSSNSQRTLQSMRRQAAPRPQAGHAQIRDRVIDEIFGRGASKR